ncbi:PREDICTED: uncharacterized protein LOC108359139 [Rhagoletis zephyria]|uniref:uncharacterized protein LOC108359139 n=1 Tax=Rhagoletis zephyria TaxID=28612 RepID=UPI0008113EF1|nr:PREDICTED: uncharacterized protein LOC108359139 [Rhagoletis zephyria]XP_017466335.1 PREDICTED: uncharacterized protein LOC108359139 [Rhagoletis zephyria]XP_017466342.1 PREDICTED: uncharacterized protein LOC108359139 [Rhagoletis zephyria]
MDAESLIEETAPMDYRLVCRTCLSSDAEFYKLDSPIFVDDDDVDEKPVSFMECLRYCTRLDDGDDCEKLEFPIYICTECSASLQVSYNFIRNALEAHEILRQKLSECPKQKQKSEKTKRKNGIVGDDGGKTTEDGVNTDGTKMRFRCKICNEKVETKKTLKEHVKLHLDIISYCCQQCSFECKKRTLLLDHYKLVHNTQATREQLKPITKQPDQLVVKKEEEPDLEDPISQEMEKIHNSEANEEFLQAKNENAQEQEEIDMALFLTPVSSNASAAAAAYVEAAAAATAADVYSEPVNATTLSMKDDHRTTMSTELQQYGTDQFNVAANELTVGNEFIVMADGTVEEVMGNGVVIEYINAAHDGVIIDNGILMDNITKVENSGEIDNQTIMNMDVDVDVDVDDIIIEESVGNDLSASSMTSSSFEPETTVQTLQNIEDEMPPPSIITAASVQAKRIKCKICTSNFQTQDKLKTHMLTHNEIPHFFCDQCAFYTFFKIDLTQHYKTKHKLQPTQKQLQPKNKVRPHEQPTDAKHIYACDMCLFETRIKSHLRRHYLSQHQEEATEVQLRPTIDESATLSQLQTSPPDSPPGTPGKPLRPDYPKGLNCKKCSKTFYWREKLKDHYRQHGCGEGRSVDNRIGEGLMSSAINISGPGTSLLKQNTMQYQIATNEANNVNALLTANIDGHNNYNANSESAIIDAQALVDAAVAEAQAAAMQINVQMTAPAPDIIMDIPVAATISTTTVPMETVVSASNVNGIPQEQEQYHHHQQSVAVMAGYACQQIPSDAIPQVVETDTTIDNSELDFVFNDALFEDFEEDENEDEENEEDDGIDFQDLILTSDDDFDDILQDQQQRDSFNANNYQPYCVHCNKKFLSQYQFENHMFVHRGLAPYRCEMCTNLYNTKRALIRHYRAVHKKMPSRDMIQAKGDKVDVDHTPIEHLNIVEQKAVTLMCAKCPFETADLSIMQIHLNSTHGLVDENFILQKLPFECPRCIRSYATRARLVRHLERSHSVATIIQQQRAANNAMRNQLQLLHQPPQQQQYQPYIAMKDTAPATTTTAAAASSSASTSASACGRGKITHSYRFNNTAAEDDDDDDDGVYVVEHTAVCAGGFEDSNNNDAHNVANKAAATTEISPLSKLIADMEQEEKSNNDITKNTHAVNQQKTKTQRAKKPAVAATQSNTRIRRKGTTETTEITKIITYDMYHQLNEDNQLFDEYACGMCAQSWRTAAELHTHECIPIRAATSKSSKGGAVNNASVATAGVENATLLMSERSQYLFKCDICQCNYKSSELLKHHMKRHTGRIFRCNHCPKTYISRTELKSHHLTHTGEKPHKCEMCPKQFRYPHHLKRHCDVVHLGKRERCPVEDCGRTFTTQAQLKIHAWIHNGNEPYRCKFCRHSFKKRESLRKHARRIHQRDLTEEEIAEIYRQSVGHTNPHDFTVSLSNGRMLRRSDVEQANQRPQKHIHDLAAESVAGAAVAEVAAVNIVETQDIQTTNEFSPLLASSSHSDMNIKLEMGVEVEDESPGASVSQTSRNSTSLSTHEDTLHTYMLPGIDDHGHLPHF